MLDFFTSLYTQGASYSAVNTAKSALLTFVTVRDNENWNLDPDIRKFFKGYFNLRTPIPRYFFSWDVDIVLTYLDNFFPLGLISLKELTFKALTLVALSSGSRAQALHLMDLSYMTRTPRKLTFYFKRILKTSKPGKVPHVLDINAFDNPTRCVFTTLSEYITRTENLRQSSELWVSFQKPFKPITKQTISRWLKTTLGNAGIDTNVFSGHSTRMASTSKAAQQGLDIQSILKTADWSSAKNFATFYKRDVVPDEKALFSQTILGSGGK